MTPDREVENRQDAPATEERPRYESPEVTDHGSLVDLTLSAGSNFSDGLGPGGSGS
jgi:hypothetical protein